jgi:coiled-coil and C2 domain-containing protein 2A|tara:strand:+ start:613 stop:1770 length:1158 start_codon:yes stop_codon:yes gene_type:complete
MFTLDPPLQSMGDEDEDLSDAGIITSESANTLKRAAAFKASYFDKKRGPINIIVPTLNGERVMATRFLTPQKPPPEVSTYLEAARYVSLIPFMEDWQLFVGSEDMWSYSSQFLELCAGDWEEHAILLRNYFAYIDGRQFDNYIVFGHGLPEGDTVYVMRRPTDEIDNEIELWNASTGVAYARSDTRCALQTISCIVTEDNIYANIQPSISPSRMKFDFMNAKQWKPFFDEKHPLPEDYSASQPEIKYTPMPQKDLEGLERQIMETLRVDLKEWRSKHYQTYLNTTVARDLQKTLEGLENHKMGREGHSEYGHLDSLKKWTSTYDLIGHPLNFTFTDVKAISYAVKDTNIHMNEDPNVKFALTVKCFGYSNGIISVWVYCAALVRR